MRQDRGHSNGRRLMVWRRALMIYGPPSAKLVGMALSEFAWTPDDDPDGDLIARRCTQDMLRQLCSYKTTRGLQKQILKLEDAEWIERDDVQTGPGVLRKYVLKEPPSVPGSAIDELANPSPGMWKRLLQANTAGAPESDYPCSSDSQLTVTGTQDPPIDNFEENHRNSDSEPPELQRTNTGNEVPDHRNSDTPLEKAFEGSCKGFGEGSVKGRSMRGIRPNGRQPHFEEMTNECEIAGVSGSDWNRITDVIERVFNFTPTEKQLNTIQRQLNDRAGK